MESMSDEEYEDYVVEYLSPRPIERVAIFLFALILVVGVCGNVLVILVVTSSSRMRTSMNILLVNLALADMLILLICLPPTIINDVTKTFWFGEAACKGIIALQNTSVYVAVLTLTYISYERWRAVTNPLDATLCHKTVVIPSMWLISAVASSPEPYTVHLVKPDFQRPNFTLTWGTQCVSSWSAYVERSYTLTQSIVFYLLPLLAISYMCYRTIHELNSATLPLGRRQIAYRKKAIRMLAVVVFVFALSYLPVHYHNLLRAFHHGDKEESVEVDVDVAAVRKVVARLFSYSSSSLNPVIYNILSRRFRKEYARLVLCRRSQEEHERTHTFKV